MLNKEMWVTKSEGIVEKIDNKIFSNENFINTIDKDNTAIGIVLKATYSTPTTIKLLGNVPEKWTKWSNEEIDPDYIKSNIDIPEEIVHSDRLWVPKSTQSDRTRFLMSVANFSVSTRGIKDRGIPNNINEALLSIIYCIYFSVEKNTIASVKNKKSYNISIDKKESIKSVYEHISNRENIINIMLGNLYTEPSMSTIKRIYVLKSIYGDYFIESIINNLYYQYCKNQVNEIKKLYEYLQDIEVL